MGASVSDFSPKLLPVKRGYKGVGSFFKRGMNTLTPRPRALLSSVSINKSSFVNERVLLTLTHKANTCFAFLTLTQAFFRLFRTLQFLRLKLIAGIPLRFLASICSEICKICPNVLNKLIKANENSAEKNDQYLSFQIGRKLAAVH